MFAKYVSESTIHLARFNYWEPSVLFKKGYRICTVYMSFLEELGLDIIVIEALKDEKSGRKRREWYFDTIPSQTDGIDDAVFNSLNTMVTRKNRIAGRDLEKRILGAIEPPYRK